MSIVRASPLVLIAIWTIALGAGCDRFARVEVNNDSSKTLQIYVNGRPTLKVPPGQRGYTGPGINERLKTLDVAFVDDPNSQQTFRLNTFRDDTVLHVSGPPLEIKLTHEKHPSATRTAVGTSVE